MNHRNIRQSHCSNKTLIQVALLAALAGYLFTGTSKGLATSALTIQEAARQEFDVTSVKRNNSGSQALSLGATPGRYHATNVSVRTLISMAYKVEDFQILGEPGWVNSERYDIEGKADGITNTQQIGGPILQTLLEDRFKLSHHREIKEVPVYLLTVAKSGPKMKSGTCLTREPDVPIAQGQRPSAFCGFISMGDTSLRATSIRADGLANVLSTIMKRKVLDKTEFGTSFDVTLTWKPDLVAQENTPSTSANSGPSIFTALEEQLGLKLESGKGPVDVLVIDHIERPAVN